MHISSNCTERRIGEAGGGGGDTRVTNAIAIVEMEITTKMFLVKILSISYIPILLVIGV